MNNPQSVEVCPIQYSCQHVNAMLMCSLVIVLSESVRQGQATTNAGSAFKAIYESAITDSASQ